LSECDAWQCGIGATARVVITNSSSPPKLPGVIDLFHLLRSMSGNHLGARADTLLTAIRASSKVTALE
jgi:hypothetical protein